MGRGFPNPIVVGHRFCAGCGRWRVASDFAFRRNGRLDSYCDACRRREFRRRYAQMTPEQRARRLEDERFYRDRLRVERGTIATYRPRGRKVVDGPAEYVFLDATPIRRELRRARNGYSLEGLARRVGVDSHTLRRYLNGESRHIRLDLADRVALAVGTTLWDVYRDAPLVAQHGHRKVRA